MTYEYNDDERKCNLDLKISKNLKLLEKYRMENEAENNKEKKRKRKKSKKTVVHYQIHPTYH